MAVSPSAVTLAVERHQNTPHHLAHQAFLGGTLPTPRALARTDRRLRRLSPAAKILVLLSPGRTAVVERPSKQDECRIAVNQT